MSKRTWNLASLPGRHDGGSMHPRNPYYANPPDFVALAKEYPALREFVSIAAGETLEPVNEETDMSKYAGKGSIAFKNPRALRELTYCLLRHDFGVEVEFPLDSLCPTIPNRANYVCWIEDIVGHDRENVFGVDIGVGASCVYPLLVCSRHPTWRMIGTEVDDRSTEYALKNVKRNHLQDRITIVKNTDANITLPLELFPDPDQRFDFCMCNPPFFEDEDDYLTSLGLKKDAPSATPLQATENELSTTGGEVHFIKRMIDESKKLQTRIRWYTSMMGKKSTANAIVAHLRQCSISNYTLATFRQGKTFRWAIAWSHHAEHAPKTVWGSVSRSLKVPKQVLSFPLPDKSPKDAFSSIIPIFESLDIEFEIVNDDDIAKNDEMTTPSVLVIHGNAYSNSWSRAARRAKARQAQGCSTSSSETFPSAKCDLPERDISEPVLGFEVEVYIIDHHRQQSAEHQAKKQRAESSPSTVEEEGDQKTTVVGVTWLVGKDRELFESFVKHLRSRLEKS